eukprot:COSAG04_NODE_142_length_23587_cov_115.049295_9_plen_88_part_00
MSGDIGVAADGTFVPVGASGAPTQRPSRAARREEEKEEKERARRKKARESAAARGGEEKKGGIRLLPTLSTPHAHAPTPPASAHRAG